METHLHTFETLVEYQSKEKQLPPPRVALIDEINSLEYAGIEEEKTYNLYDILWSDGTATQEVRPVSDGVTPIGLCVIPTNWLDEGEKARFVSLKYMSNNDTPENGSHNADMLYWGYEYGDANSDMPCGEPEDDPIKKYYVPYTCKNENSNQDMVDTATYILLGNKHFKDLRDRDSWLYTLNYCKQNPGKYAIGDINGKQNTINTSVEGNYFEGAPTGREDEYYKDMKKQVAKYAPTGTQVGDWYVPAIGELLQFVFRLRSDQNNPSINDKLAEIAKVYPQDCVSKFSDDWQFYWASTVHNNDFAFRCYIHNNNLSILTDNRTGWHSVIAYLLR